MFQALKRAASALLILCLAAAPEAARDVLGNDIVMSMYEVAADRALAAVETPVLAIYGARDDVIAPGLSYAAALEALRDHRDPLVVSVPGIAHELLRAEPPPPGAPVPKDGTLPVVTDTVGDWVARRLRPARPLP